MSSEKIAEAFTLLRRGIDILEKELQQQKQATDNKAVQQQTVANPDDKVKRFCFAFSNGIFDVERPTLWKKDQIHGWQNATQKCVNTFPDVPCSFVDGTLATLETVMNTPTPLFDSIFECQGMGRDVILWVYVFFGRMFFPLHRYEKWQAIPLFVGASCTGKTVLSQLLCRIFSPKFTGQLSRNTCVQFGLESLVDKFILLCPDVRQGFNFPSNVLESMIHGYNMRVPRIHRQDLYIQWNLPSMAFGNEVPWSTKFVDDNIVPFLFEHSIDESKVNPNLLDNIVSQELGVLIPKVVFVYRQMALKHKNHKIQTVLPEYFKVAMKKLCVAANE